MKQKLHHKIVAMVLVLALLPNIFYASPVNAQTTFAQSVNVAVISSLGVINGGTFPTTTSGSSGSFTDFNFYLLPVGSVSSTALGPGGVCGSAGCDTVLLNVASSGMGCNVNSLSTQQKTDLVNFVGNGYKLIIYDSECSPQDYSWLPYTFATVNPGAQGAQGILTIVEENTLSSNDPSSPYFIDANMLGTQTDAVGDMNVMTTFDPNWFLDMSGTNILGVTGPVHTYAKFPSGTDYGLIIYNGLDVDYMSAGTAPDSSTPGGNLAKIWLQELQQPFNPSQLPGGVPVVGIALTPANATLPVGQNHTVTAALTNLLANPQPGIQVSFSVDSGPNAGATGICSANSDCTTDANGQVNFTYIGTGGSGVDQIKGCFLNGSGQTICSQVVMVEWSQTAPPMVERRAPYDFVTELNGLVNCNSSFVIGTGETKVDSRIDNGGLLIDVKARSLNGRADGRAGVGVLYTAPITGKIIIETDIVVAGFDSISSVGIEKLGETAIASIRSSVEISVVRIGPRRDNQSQTDFASRIMLPTGNPLPSNPVDMVRYHPSKTYSNSLEFDVLAGDQLYICAGLSSKAQATGLIAWLGTAKALYGATKSDRTRVDVIRISYK